MLRVSDINENIDNISLLLSKRNIDVKDKLVEILKIDKSRRSIQSELDGVLAESNKLAKEIGDLFKSGQTEKASILKEKASSLKPKSKSLSEKLSSESERLKSLLLDIPNVPNKLVPNGSGEQDNLEVFKNGNIPDLNTTALPHWELASKHDIIDFDLGNKITGAGFPVYKNKGAKLQRALINYFIDKNTEAGYKEIQVPILINEDSGMGTGQLPDKEGQMYHITNDNLYLAPTAEVPVTNIYRDSIIKSSELPIRLTSYTPCFRREAGSYGAHVRGLNRLHQFDKVEIVRIEQPENSYSALEEMVDHVKGILD